MYIQKMNMRLADSVLTEITCHNVRTLFSMIHGIADVRSDLDLIFFSLWGSARAGAIL